MTGEWVQIEVIPHARGEAIDRAAQIGRTNSDVDPDRR
jgi:hypothetical protein